MPDPPKTPKQHAEERQQRLADEIAKQRPMNSAEYVAEPRVLLRRAPNTDTFDSRESPQRLLKDAPDFKSTSDSGHQPPTGPGTLSRLGNSARIIAVTFWLFLATGFCPAEDALSQRDTKENALKYWEQSFYAFHRLQGLKSATPLTAADTHKRFSRNVVEVFCLNELGETLNQGSGIILRAKNDLRLNLLTSFHVVRAASRIRVVTPLGDEFHGIFSPLFQPERDWLIGHLLGEDKVGGLPKETVEKYAFVGVAGPPEVGSKLFVLGNPLGLHTTISEGLLSGFRQAPDGKFLQITAPVSPGSSGGPIFNEFGQLVGIVSRTLEAGQNLNFATPVSQMAQDWNELTYETDPYSQNLEEPQVYRMWHDINFNPLKGEPLFFHPRFVRALDNERLLDHFFEDPILHAEVIRKLIMRTQEEDYAGKVTSEKLVQLINENAASGEPEAVYNLWWLGHIRNDPRLKPNEEAIQKAMARGMMRFHALHPDRDDARIALAEKLFWLSEWSDNLTYAQIWLKIVVESHKQQLIALEKSGFAETEELVPRKKKILQTYQALLRKPE